MAEKNIKKSKGNWYFNVVEEIIRNEDFINKNPCYSSGRIEIWNEDEPYDVDEIRLVLPSEMWEGVREALDFKNMTYFQIGNHNSDDLDKYLLTKKKK